MKNNTKSQAVVNTNIDEFNLWNQDDFPQADASVADIQKQWRTAEDGTATTYRQEKKKLECKVVFFSLSLNKKQHRPQTMFSLIKSSKWQDKQSDGSIYNFHFLSAKKHVPLRYDSILQQQNWENFISWEPDPRYHVTFPIICCWDAHSALEGIWLPPVAIL